MCSQSYIYWFVLQILCVSLREKLNILMLSFTVDTFMVLDGTLTLFSCFCWKINLCDKINPHRYRCLIGYKLWLYQCQGIQKISLSFLFISVSLSSIAGMEMMSSGQWKSKAVLSCGTRSDAWLLYCFWLAKVLNLLMCVTLFVLFDFKSYSFSWAAGKFGSQLYAKLHYLVCY